MPLIPYAAQDQRPDADGVAAGVHYLGMDAARGAEAGDGNPQSVADAAWSWYQGHALHEHARAIAEAVLMDDNRLQGKKRCQQS